MNTKNILSIIIVVAFLGVIGYIFSQSPPEGGQVACTKEAKVCPDGSIVGRVGPKCEFAACPVAENTGSESGNNIEYTTKNYKDSNGEFTFDYNSLFRLATGNRTTTLDWRLNATAAGLVLAKVSAEKAFMPGTNFSEAVLTIGRSSLEINNCEKVDVAKSEVSAGKATVSGFPFTKFTSGDAGAGNFYDTTSYRGLIDGDCYSLEYTIHSTNIGNYSPDQGIKEFDRFKIVAEMEKIVKSYKSLINSD